MIKRLIDLSMDEMKKVQLYLNNLEKSDKSISEIKEQFNTKVYNFGEGIVFYFSDDKVVGSVRIILEAIKYLSTSYIHFLNVEESIEEDANIVKELLKFATNMVEAKGCSKILLGVRDEKMIKILNSLGYSISYNAYKMRLEDRKVTSVPLQLISLCEENKKDYLDIFNRSFSDMPHGCYYEMDDIEEYLADASGNKYYLVQDENSLIGFMNKQIEDNVGIFDIGLCKEYRGIGYGRRLLDTAIDALNKANVSAITLVVIEKNSIAFNMYLQRGFVIYSIINQWIEIRK